VIDCLADVVMDEEGKPVKAPGRHLEDAILLGYFLHRLGLPARIQGPSARPRDEIGDMLRREFGRDIRRPQRTRQIREAFRTA